MTFAIPQRRAALSGGVRFVPDQNQFVLAAVNDRHTVPGASNAQTDCKLNTVNVKYLRKAPADSDINDLQSLDCGWNIISGAVGESANLYDFTVSRTIERSGTRYQMTWDGGSTSKLITKGLGNNVYSDKLTLPADIPAAGAYIERVHMVWDFRPPVATLAVTGGAITGLNISDGGKNLNLAGVSTLLSATYPTGTGANITLNVSGGQLTGATVNAGGSGYVNGASVTFAGGVAFQMNGNNGNSTYGDRRDQGNGLSDQTVTGDPTGTTMTSLYTAASIYAARRTTGPSIGYLGDSIIYGVGDTVDATGRVGFVERCIAGAKGTQCWGKSSQFMEMYLSNGLGRKRSLLRTGALTHLIFQFPRNDAYAQHNGSSYTYGSFGELQTSVRQALTPFIRAGIKVFPCTLPPYTTGTFTSAAGQSVPDQTRRDIANAYNAWLLTPATLVDEGFTGVVDLDGVLRDPSATDKWRSDGGTARTADGIHPNATGVQDIITAGICAAGLFV